MRKSHNLPVLCVLGNWSSGTTAVTGYIERLGAFTCPPHVRTNDPRTPDSYESLEFRNQCANTVDEGTFSDLGDRKAFKTWLQGWIRKKSAEAALSGCSHIAIKHPLSAFLVSEIHEACNPKWIVVTRPFDKIEGTRLRRKWHPYYGAQGANKVYSSIFSSLIKIEASYLTISFTDFLSGSIVRQQLIAYSGINPNKEKKAHAEGWVR